MRRPSTWIVPSFALLLFVTSAAGQANVQQPACPAAVIGAAASSSERFPSYELRTLSPEEVLRIDRLLDQKCWEQALRIFFKTGWQAELVDWVVHLKNDGTVQQTFIRGSHSATEFRGAKYVWVIIFSDWAPDVIPQGSPGADSLAVRFPSMSFAIRSINYEKDPFITAGVKAITGKLFGAIDPAVPSGRPDSTQTVTLTQISQDSTKASMYVGSARYTIVDNSQVELALTPGPGQRFPRDLRSVYGNMGNASTSWFELGIAGGLASGDDIPTIVDDTLVVGARKGIEPNIYLMGYLNINRPELPWNRQSWGLALGTNLVGNLLDDIVLGATYGRILGGLGLVAGISRRVSSSVEADDSSGRAHRTDGRISRFFIGIDMRF